MGAQGLRDHMVPSAPSPPTPRPPNTKAQDRLGRPLRPVSGSAILSAVTSPFIPSLIIIPPSEPIQAIHLLG